MVIQILLIIPGPLVLTKSNRFTGRNNIGRMAFRPVVFHASFSLFSGPVFETYPTGLEVFVELVKDLRDMQGPDCDLLFHCCIRKTAAQ